ncbi:MAG: hypothetical protein F6K30_09690 [Cyanothece sp. SIO2G6]|nr:hypothetical protein [Cyanothece sp. SIO2G6]
MGTLRVPTKTTLLGSDRLINSKSAIAPILIVEIIKRSCRTVMESDRTMEYSMSGCQEMFRDRQY